MTLILLLQISNEGSETHIVAKMVPKATILLFGFLISVAYGQVRSWISHCKYLEKIWIVFITYLLDQLEVKQVH